MSWATLTIELEDVRKLSPSNPIPVLESETLSSAKDRLGDLLERLLAGLRQQHATRDAFLDALATAATGALVPELEKLLAMAYLVVFHFDRYTMEGDNDYLRYLDWQTMLTSRIETFGSSALQALDVTLLSGANPAAPRIVATRFAW